MGDEKDVLQKADALLRRHSIAAASGGSDTGSVPVLTDLVDAPESLGADDAELRQEIFARVLAEVEGRLATDLERRLAERLVPQVHAAVASALGDLRQELANAIGDALAEALKGRTLK